MTRAPFTAALLLTASSVLVPSQTFAAELHGSHPESSTSTPESEEPKMSPITHIDQKIDYLELPAGDLPAVKAFYEKAFGWSFTDYGPEYTAFSDGKLEGGFYSSEGVSTTANGAVLVVLYATDLEGTKEKVVASGGTIVKDIFSFPGGRRFHFADPHGNELAVWSDR